ncbi:hypothetical protein CMV_005672 [Castanea mollissima]|uniref:Reverse transcriptase zinc-binding domain-containing protein n=1 Tax=Castanea mollissima TaxID=60419 RepID=A0A8J4W1H9_9ROSI|nr:hypothetical protein CMV_005672 [Castanea mollissima]
MTRGMDTFNKGAMWTIGRDSSLNFWLDSWMARGPLRHLIQGPLTREATQLKEWLRSNGKDSSIRGGLQWRILFPFAVWSIWKSRNQSVFNGKSQNPRLATSIRAQAFEFLCCAASPRQAVCNVIKQIRWERPPNGWKKLNTDGSRMGSNGQAGCGGIVRDEHER